MWRLSLLSLPQHIKITTRVPLGTVESMRESIPSDVSPLTPSFVTLTLRSR